jgi:O-antigen/teichoic acid export membrane protein
MALLLGGRLTLLGIYRSAVAYLGIALVFADLGLTSIFVREISRPGADQARLIGNALALRAAIATIVLALAAGLALVLPFAPDVRLGILVGAGGFVAYSLHLLLFGLFQQKLRQHGVVIAELTGGLLLLAIIAALGQIGAEPVWFVVALASSYGVTLVVTIFAARRLAPIGLRLEPGIWRSLIVAALPLAATDSMGVLFYRADIVILAFLQPPGEVGLYGVSVKVIDALTGLTLLVVGLFAPLFGRTAGHSAAEFARHLENALTTLMIGAMGVAVALVVLAEEIVVLLGGDAFRAAATPLMLLGVVFVLHSALVTLREAAIALRVQTKLLPGYSAGLAVALLAYFALIPRFGASGAAVALIIAEIVILFLTLRVVTRAAGHPINPDPPLRAVGSGVAVIALAFVLKRAGVVWPVQIVACGVSYGLMLLLTRAVDLPQALALGRDALTKKRAH